MTRLLPLLLLMALIPAPQGTVSLQRTTWSSGSSPDATRPNGAPSAKASIRDASSNLAVVPPAAPAPSGQLGTAITGGYISWAEPDLGPDYLATRFPRGTLVRLCVKAVCIIRRSTDFGPSAAIDPPRIADLAVLDWEQLTGLPRDRGLALGTVEAIDEIALPATDTLPATPGRTQQ